MSCDVTIGIPVYRAQPYIRRALESALGQTFPSVEVLLVDDGSDDGTFDVVGEVLAEQQKAASVRILKNGVNRGVAASRNRIIDEAKGNYLYFMDADDEIETRTIALLMEQVRHYGAEMVLGSYDKTDTDGRRQCFQYPSLQLNEPDGLASFAYRKYGGLQASACNYLVSTSVLRNCGLRFIDTDYWEDMAFTFNLVTHISRAVLLPDVTYHYYCREGSLSRYQQRDTIGHDEIMRNVATVNYLKDTSAALAHKDYYPLRLLNIMKTDFYMARYVIRRRRDIVPAVTDSELKAMMAHPATLRQIVSFRQARMANLAFWLLGRLPARLCVNIISILTNK